MSNRYPNHRWTPERIEHLISLVREGYSGSVIAAKLGVSRNAIIGKAHRLGMALGNSRNGMSYQFAARLRKPAVTPDNKGRKYKKKPKVIASKPQFEKAPIPPPSIDDIARVKFPELEPQHCRFGVGDPRNPDFGFCGLERIPGSVYCRGHHARTHQPVPVRASANPRETTPVKIDA